MVVRCVSGEDVSSGVLELVELVKLGGGCVD